MIQQYLERKIKEDAKREEFVKSILDFKEYEKVVETKLQEFLKVGNKDYGLEEAWKLLDEYAEEYGFEDVKMQMDKYDIFDSFDLIEGYIGSSKVLVNKANIDQIRQEAFEKV